MTPPACKIQRAWRDNIAARAVSGESLPEPSAFFTGAKSSARSPRTTHTDFAYLYVSKMKASSLMPFGDDGSMVCPVFTSKYGIFLRATWCGSAMSKQHLDKKSNEK